MKARFSLFALSTAACASIAFLAGCAAPDIQVSIKTPGEFKLGGISKLAIVKFNSLQDDGAVGAYSADEETVRIMQAMVSNAFSAGKTYKVTNLENENAIADNAGSAGRTALLATMNSRFDAVIYGRVWWQVSPETRGQYPKLFSALEEWENVRYTKQVLGQPVEMVKPITTKTKDALQIVPFRTQRASLMLSLSIYRLDASGMVSKVVETYSVASHDVSFDDGGVSHYTSLIGSRDRSRAAEVLEANANAGGFFGGLLGNSPKKAPTEVKFSATQNTSAIPSTLQMKCEMANSMVGELSQKLQPSKVTFALANTFSDKKLALLLQDNAFLAGRNYSEYALKENLRDEYNEEKAKQILDERAKILDDPNIPEAYEKSSDRFKDAAENNIEYIYSSALCEEGLGHFKDALYMYRLAFEVEPTFETAMGISRCLFAMDMAERVKEIKKDTKKAEKKAGLK